MGVRQTAVICRYLPVSVVRTTVPNAAVPPIPQRTMSMISLLVLAAGAVVVLGLIREAHGSNVPNRDHGRRIDGRSE